MKRIRLRRQVICGVEISKQSYDFEQRTNRLQVNQPAWLHEVVTIAAN